MRPIRGAFSGVLLAVMLAAAVCGGPAAADGLGVVLAPAGDRISEDEALYAEAVVAALVAEGQRAVFLHGASPLARSAGINLPAVRADDDWTPLTGVLDTIATRIRLDYVLLTSLVTDGEQMVGQGLLVVRGGQGTERLRAPATELQDAAARLAEVVISAGRQLPAPIDRSDDAVPVQPVAAPDRGDTPVEPGLADDAPAPSEDVSAETDATAKASDDAALPIAEEPLIGPEPGAEAAPGPTDPAPRPIDDALAEAEVAYEDGRLGDAEALLNVSVREAGPSAQAHYLRARLSLARQDRDAAISDLQSAAGMDPSLVEAHVWLGRLLAEQGLWQTAQGHYERAVKADPMNRDALLGLARLYRDHGHSRRAIDLLSEAVGAGKSDPAVLMLLAELHGRDGNVALAERYFVRAADAATGEQEAAAWERLGDLYVKLNRHREALTCYVKAAELNPSRSRMAERRYSEVMGAADSAVHEALTATWSTFEAFAHEGTGQREIVYRRLSEMHAQLQEAMRFAESVTPPGDLREGHTGRQFAYSLAVEAAVLALSWLDLGDASMLERAGEVHSEAVAQFDALSRPGRE